jgi:L,D-transpeptidase ErfK/SrfK
MSMQARREGDGSVTGMRLLRVLALGVVVGLCPASPLPAQLALEQALGRMAPLFGKPQQYQRKGEESIYAIARRFGVSASAIHNANDGDLKAGDEVLLIPTERIAPLPAWEAANLAGESAPPGSVSVVINLAERNLYVYRDARPIRCYPVAIGMRGWETPTGEFTIANKRKNPTWFPPKWAIEEEPVPPGPKNPLGDRWMGLSAPGYGIHATNAPSSVGRYVSHGCIRMYPEHAEELYELVRVGTPVRIVYEPVVFGYRADDGVVYLAYHPDPYGLGEVEEREVRERLAEWGLAELADEQAVGAALQATRGTPTAVVGSSVKVTVDGKPIRFALAPIRRGDDWLVPAGPVASALGAGMDIGPDANFVSMERDTQRVFLSPGDREALVNGQVVELSVGPQLAAGYPLVPVAAVARALGASVGFDQASNTVLIWDGGRGYGWAR